MENDNEDTDSVYAVVLEGSDCTGTATRTYESLQRPSSAKTVTQDNRKRNTRNRRVVILVALVSSLLSVAFTCAITVPLIKDVAVNSYHFKFNPSDCPNGWLKNGFTCYHVSGDKKTWFQANDFCRSFGSELVSFHDHVEEIIISRKFQNVSRYWIGLNDVDNNGKFEWSDGTVLDHTNWGDYEPNNFNGVEHCVEVKTESIIWNDGNCYFPQHFICKIQLSSQCGHGSWIFFKNSCYMFNTRVALSWNDAKIHCKINYADLVSIQSREELDFLLSQFSHRYSYWIGLNNRNRQGKYTWIDSTVSWELPWDRNHPISYYDSCGLINTNGNFLSYNCDNEFLYVCEKQL